MERMRHGGLFAIALLALLCTLHSCKEDTSSRGPGGSAAGTAAGSGADAGQRAAGGGTWDNGVLATFPNQTLTVAMYQAYSRESPSATPEDYLLRVLASRDVEDRKLLSRGDPGKMARMLYLAALGQDYQKNALEEKFPVSGEDVRDELPKVLRKGNFDILAFRAEEEARKAAESIRTEEDFDRAAKEKPERLKKTGEIYPGSGFFHESDDAILFNSRKGQVRGYMETGIGPGVVKVREVRDLTPAETSELLKTVVEGRKTRLKKSYLDGLLPAHRIAVDRAAIRRMAEREMRDELTPVDRDRIAALDNIVVTTADLKNWLGADYREFDKTVTAARLVKLYNNDIDVFIRRMVLGMEAENSGFRMTAPARSAYERQRDGYGFEVAIIGETGGKAWIVPEKEMRKYYEANRNTLYLVPERVRAGFIMSRSKEKAELVREKLLAGKDFKTLAQDYSDDRETAHLGGGDVWIRKGGNTDPIIQNVIFPRHAKAGAETGIIRTDNGYFIFHVYEHGPERRYRFEEVRSHARRMVIRDRIEAAKTAYLAALKDRYKVSVNERAVEALSAAKPGAGKVMPTGHPKLPH